MWTDGQTDERTDGHFRHMLLGRLGGDDLKRIGEKVKTAKDEEVNRQRRKTDRKRYSGPMWECQHDSTDNRYISTQVHSCEHRVISVNTGVVTLYGDSGFITVYGDSGFVTVYVETDRHVRSTSSTTSLCLGVDKPTTDAEITQLDATSFIQENVRWLHICNTQTDRQTDRLVL